ncbi:MAG: hypothetical protein GF308_21010 [Candidatus Heimdallarchaeota archaeon]|nr:hypothetical protein [Candidatus Heimdallarchaeota archaeon]
MNEEKTRVQKNEKAKEINTSNTGAPTITTTNIDENKQRTNNIINEKEEQPQISMKEAIFSNLIVGIFAASVYFPLEFVITVPLLGLSGYYRHVLVTLICFVLIPLIYLTGFRLIRRKKNYYFTTTREGLRPKKIISSLLQGIFMHAGIFYPWIVISQKFLPNVKTLSYFLPKPIDWFLWLFFVALNVIMFEFYSKAFVQLQFSKAKGSILLIKKRITIHGGYLLGFILQNLVWLGGHVQEFFWLKDYLGVANSICFILVSGILTGLTVWKTQNIFGVTFGHILLNVLVTLTYAFN